MIPTSYPSSINSLTGDREMVVSVLASVSGLVRWTDYIPIQFIDVIDYDATEGVTDNNGFIPISVVATTGLVSGTDYIPVYIDQAGTDSWRVNSVGFIPVEYSGYSSYREVLTFGGAEFGTLGTIITAASGDTVEIKCSSTNVDANGYLIDAIPQTAFIKVHDTNKIQFSTAHYSSVLIDGVAATHNVTEFPRDGKEHTISAVISDACTIGYIGIFKGGDSQHWVGQIFSVKYTDTSTGAVQDYVFDSGSTVEQYARGSLTNKVTLTSVVAGDWETFIFSKNPPTWTAEDGSPVIPIA